METTTACLAPWASFVVLMDHLNTVFTSCVAQISPQNSWHSSLLPSQQPCEAGKSYSLWLAHGDPASFHGGVGIWTKISEILVHNPYSTLNSEESVDHGNR